MLFNSDARCKAGNYEREARLEGKAENVDAVLFERQGKDYRRRSEMLVKTLKVSLTRKHA